MYGHLYESEIVIAGWPAYLLFVYVGYVNCILFLSSLCAFVLKTYLFKDAWPNNYVSSESTQNV